MAEFSSVPRRTSIEFSNQLQGLNSQTAIEKFMREAQKQKGYTNNKCVRCLTRAYATHPKALLDFVPMISDWICHDEEGKPRNSRDYIKAQQNFLGCVERIFREAQATSRRPSGTLASIAEIAAQAVGPGHQLDADLTPTNSTHSLDLSSINLNTPDSVSPASVDLTDEVMKVLESLMMKLNLCEALEGSVMLRWFEFGANLTGSLEESQQEVFRSMLTPLMEWLRSDEEDDYEMSSSCDES